MSTYVLSASRFVSVVLHPLFIPLYAFLITMSMTGHFHLELPAHALWMVAGAIFLLTAAIPSLIFYIMLRMNMISSLQMPYRHERNIPVLITALAFYITYQLLNLFGLAPLFSFYMLAASMLSLVALGINLWLKISLHMVALGALSGSMAVFAMLFGEQFLVAAIVATIAAGVAGVARLALNAHRQLEVYLGFVVGFVWMYVLFALIK